MPYTPRRSYRTYQPLRRSYFRRPYSRNTRTTNTRPYQRRVYPKRRVYPSGQRKSYVRRGQNDWKLKAKQREINSLQYKVGYLRGKQQPIFAKSNIYPPRNEFSVPTDYDEKGGGKRQRYDRIINERPPALEDQIDVDL